jgi:outer membrane protein TolC
MSYKYFLTAFVTTIVMLPASYADDTTTVTDQPLSSGNTLSLQDALDIALRNNQGLAQLQFNAEASSAIPSQDGALPDPILGFNALNLPTDTFDRDQEPMTQMQIALSQTFPFPGKRGLKREASERDASAAGKQVLDKRLQIAAAVRGAWWQLAYLDHAIQIIQQNQGLMRDFVEIAQTKYKVGKGLQQDVLLAQLELSRLLNRQLPLEGMRNAAQADLNTLMNRPANQAIRLPEVLPNANLPELPAESELLEQALGVRPILDVERERVEAARLRMDVAKKDSYPDLKIGAAYGFRDYTDPTGRDVPDLASFLVSINVPIYSSSKQSKLYEQRSSDYFGSKHAFNESVRTVDAAIARNYAYYQAARDQVALYGQAIIPQAQQTVSAMLSAYQVNKVDFLSVLNTQITLYNAQISYWEALSNAKKSLASLAASVGSENLYE